MTPDDLSALHALCFDDAPAPWSARSFAALVSDPACCLVTCDNGFALARAAGPEAELLTIAVHPAHRREGHAYGLLRRIEAALKSRGVGELFCEVARSNTAAAALYARAGFVAAGVRVSYYRKNSGLSEDALIMKKILHDR